MGFTSICRTHVGLRRKINEDSTLDLTDAGLWAVADGMGGHEAGEVASRMVVDALGELPPGDLEAQMAGVRECLSRVNLELIRLARADHVPKTIGTTVAGLVTDGEQFRCFWAGDSRAYRLRGGQIVQLTRDHSLVQDLVEAGMLAPEEAENHPNANVITRAVGVTEALKIDVAEGDVRPGDLFLLASDGLTRVVRDDELAVVLSRRDPADAADLLITTVLERGAPDNVSLIIVRRD